MSDDPLFTLYKRARNRLRRYEPQSMLTHAVDALHKVHSSGTDVMRQYQPWNILLAMKWMLQEADTVSHRRPTATLSDFHAVLRTLNEIDGNVRMPSTYEHVTLFMRHLAFQQFWLQRGASAEALGRQDLLFSSLPDNHLFVQEFYKLTGLRPTQFMELAFSTLTQLLETPAPKAISRLDFKDIEQGLPPGTLNKFLQSLSKSVPELHSWLGGTEFEGMSVADQKILPTPLVDTPLIRMAGGSYTIVSPILLMRSLESFVYRTLRRSNPEEFGKKFGPMFETYVGRCLTDAGLHYIDEKELEAKLPGLGKCVDFLLIEDDCQVLLDAKGIEMSPRGRVSQRADLVLETIKSSAVKAIEQAMATAARIRKLPATHALARGREEVFLLVVTFDDLFLGSSFDFGAIFGEHVLPRLERDYGMPLPIPIEHIFFLSIDDLEWLLACVRAKDASVGDILRHARNEDRSHRTRKFMFQQHLATLCPQEKRLPMLQKALDGLCQRCIQLLPSDLR
jgi:hypothetical protein